MLRIALIGCGSHSTHCHAPAMARHVAEHPGEVDLAAACDPRTDRAEKCCGEFGFARAYGGLGEMLDAERLDGCVCVMAVDNIVDTAVDLFGRRMPCVIEKPPGACLDDARRLAMAARQTDAVHMVSLNRRFNPYIARAVQWAREIGPIRHISARMIRHARKEPAFHWGTALHVIDAVLHLGGEPSQCRTRVIDPPDLSARWFHLSMQLAGGCSASVEILPTAGMCEEVYDLFGEGYRATVGFAVPGPTRVECRRADRLELAVESPADEPTYVSDGNYAEFSHFVAALRAGGAIHPCMPDVLGALEICAMLAPNP